ncbi:MAG TPA: acetate--CoA ligase family protein, partial [Burkholderiales bacterium]|nr:acetate--CoA ligase family protein [Burkholderiales bacterium]
QRDASDKGVVFFWTASRGDKTTLPKLKASNIPIFYSPEKLARGLKFMIDYHAWRDSRTTGGAAKIFAPDAAQKKVLQQLGTVGRTTLSESESKQAIAAWGVSAPREILATSAAAATEAAKKIGYPVVMKVDSPDILHKTEAGVVRLGLRNADEVQAAYAEIMANAAQHAANAKINGAIVQEMVTGGVEVIVGVSYDAQLGPMLLFGSGGVMVEVYNDVALRHCPITRSEAVEMIAEVKGAKLLRGFRGKPAADVDALADTLVRVSQLAVHLDGKLAELDINPLMVLPKGQGVKAVDALVVLHG